MSNKPKKSLEILLAQLTHHLEQDNIEDAWLLIKQQYSFILFALDKTNDELTNKINDLFDQISHIAKNLSNKNQYDEALYLYNALYQHKGNDINLVTELADIQFKKANYYQALSYYQLLSQYYPDDINIHHQLSYCLYWSGAYYEAQSIMNRLYQKWGEGLTNQAKAFWGYINALLGQYEKIEFHQQNHFIESNAELFKEISPKWWRGQSITNKRVAIICDQGYGDQILFLRYLKTFHRDYQAYLKLFVFHVMQPLICHNFEIDEISLVPEKYSKENFEDVDVIMLLSSLLVFYWRDMQHIPFKEQYLKVPICHQDKWQSLIPNSNKIKIGITWQGNPQLADTEHRDLPNNLIASLFKFKMFDFYQLGINQNISTEILQKNNYFDLTSNYQNFLDTAAQILQMDLVITVDSSTAHLCGALGKRALVFIRKSPAEWRWLTEGGDCPWYNSLQLVRQQYPYQWQESINYVQKELSRLARKPLEKNLNETTQLKEYQLDDIQLHQTRYGFLYSFSNDNYIGKSINQYGEYSQTEITLLEKHINASDTVIDVGANIGTHTLFFSKKITESGAVISIEPQKIIYDLLKENIHINKLSNVTTHQFYLDKEEGIKYIEPKVASHLDNFGTLSHEDNEGDAINKATLDSLKLEKCDFIKLDAQGKELEVLVGASNTIKEFMPIMYIYCEIKERTPSLISFLMEYQYQLYWHTAFYFNENNYYHDHLNIFGNSASFNILCFPKDKNVIQTPELRKVEGIDDWFFDE